MARLAPRSKAARVAPRLPQGLIDELERRHAGMARHMARAVVTLVRWDNSPGVPPQRDAIVRACAAGLDLFLAAAREARPATQEELRRVAQLGILQARSSQSVEPILAAYRIAARVAWDEILRAWQRHQEATPEAIMLIANYVFAALDQVAAEVTKTYLHSREQHMQRGTRAHARLFHSLISDNFDSELELQRQALAINTPLVATGYVAVVCKLVMGNRDGERGGQALAAGRKLRPDSIAHRHDDVIPHLVLAQNPLLAERFVSHSLGPLMDPKVRNREQLLETLEAYLARGSVKEAAAALGLHRHTVLYRLEKLRELLGGDLDVPATRLRLQLALDLQKLL